MANVYDKGDLVRCSATFKNSAGAEIDPSAVTFKFEDPSGDATTYVYGIDIELVRDDEGDYHVDISLDESGVWSYRWESTGVGEAAEERYFEVRPSLFD